MTKKEEKKVYEAPALTVVTFKTERGYALSGPIFALGFSDEYGDEDVEDRTDGGHWGGSDGWF